MAAKRIDHALLIGTMRVCNTCGEEFELTTLCMVKHRRECPQCMSGLVTLDQLVLTSPLTPSQAAKTAKAMEKTLRKQFGDAWWNENERIAKAVRRYRRWRDSGMNRPLSQEQEAAE